MGKKHPALQSYKTGGYKTKVSSFETKIIAAQYKIITAQYSQDDLHVILLQKQSNAALFYLFTVLILLSKNMEQKIKHVASCLALLQISSMFYMSSRQLFIRAFS